ncbi:MAG: DNA polymerase IV [Actinomycetota bacterium]|nr:DNA polymerase IV [Actinomycetota bacterium]MDA3004600.1 DNA polymerase IV [Actinomycetota bacterium]
MEISRPATVKTILHVDMDMFYVAVELRRNPQLRGLPVVVGGDGSRGVVAAASYEARRFGVFSAMSSAQAKRLCPQAIFLPGDHDLYSQVSAEVFEVFHTITPLVEGLSLDEAFLDVTGARRLLGEGTKIAEEIRVRVKQATQLICSVGVAPNKFLAKLASVFAKPRANRDGVEPGHGVYEVQFGRELAFLHPLPVESLWGVGPVTLEKLAALSIKTVGDVAKFDRKILLTVLGGSLGEHLFELSHGIDDRSVEPDRDAKSIGHEETFSTDIKDLAVAHEQLLRLADAVSARCRNAGVGARTISLKIKFADFQIITRAASVEFPVTTTQAMMRLVEPLLREIDISGGVRLLGISARNLVEPEMQLSLFDDATNKSTANELDAAWSSTTSAIDDIRDKFGDAAIKPASALSHKRKPGSSKWGPSDPH